MSITNLIDQAFDFLVEEKNFHKSIEKINNIYNIVSYKSGKIEICFYIEEMEVDFTMEIRIIAIDEIYSISTTAKEKAGHLELSDVRLYQRGQN